MTYEVPELAVDVYLAENKQSDHTDIARLVSAFNKVKSLGEYKT
ncbi:hypothetical protein [Aestuariibacter salexigens]|nr:hypothetical protein [Aestuariibacter salexigens]